MKVQIKRLAGNKWSMVPLAELVGKSISDFCCIAQETVVVAMFMEGSKKPDVIFSNNEDQVAYYKKSGMPSFYAPDIAEYMSGEVKVHMIAEEVFEGSEFIKIGRKQEQLELDSQ